jgi:hypothetical protein
MIVLLQWSCNDPASKIDHYVINLQIAGSCLEVGFVAQNPQGDTTLQYHHEMKDPDYGLLADGHYIINAINSKYKPISKTTSTNIGTILDSKISSVGTR